MTKLALFSLLACTGLTPVFAADSTENQEAMCRQWADEENLAGDERQSYLRRCMEEMENDSLPAMDPLYQNQATSPSFLDSGSGGLFEDEDDGDDNDERDSGH